MQQTVGGWFGGATPTPTPGSAAVVRSLYYAGVEGMKVYSEPSASSKVVGTLALHEKVTRTKLEKGFAYVESSKGAVKGWVTNAQLIWRLPSAPTTGAPAAAEPAPAAAPAETPPEPEVVEPTAPAAPPPPKATPVPRGTPHGPAPSIFNPY